MSAAKLIAVYAGVALVVGVIVAAVALVPAARNALDRSGQQPSPPPPSDVTPQAPGPDNTITTFIPPPSVPPQPPSPTPSETDPTKKPKVE